MPAALRTTLFPDPVKFGFTLICIFVFWHVVKILPAVLDFSGGLFTSSKSFTELLSTQSFVRLLLFFLVNFGWNWPMS